METSIHITFYSNGIGFALITKKSDETPSTDNFARVSLIREKHSMTVHIFSFDFDGCLFHKGYLNSANKDVIEHNQEFLQKIKVENVHSKRSKLFIGSNRQSKKIDDDNSSETGSCFFAAKQISEFLDVTLDTFLLADIYGNLSNGTSFVRATNAADQTLSHSDYLFDETKLTIIYAQMHKIAMENPEDLIIFNFYDDRNYQEGAYFNILDSLTIFFTNYPDLIPHNLRLRLNHYAGKETTLFSEFVGVGIIDMNYRQTVLDMARIARFQAFSGDGIQSFLNTCFYVKPELLTHRNPYEVGKTTSDQVALNLSLGVLSKNTTVEQVKVVENDDLGIRRAVV